MGVHALEDHGGRWFRWTEPIVLLRLALPAGEHALCIETARLRGAPLDAVVAVVAGGHLLPRALLANEDQGELVVRLPSRWSAAATRGGIVLVCFPLVPARRGSPDGRRLGLPVLSVAVEPTGVAAPVARPGA